MKYKYSGSYCPGTNGFAILSKTFSVGIYPLIVNASGNGWKKGAVEVRVKGLSSQSEKVYKKAEEIIKQLEAGTYLGPKTVTILE